MPGSPRLTLHPGGTRPPTTQEKINIRDALDLASDEQGVKADSAVQPQAAVPVANAAARKLLSSYDAVGGAIVGFTKVLQADRPNVTWLLVSADVTQDASWHSFEEAKLNNYSATVAPGPNDDSTDGYSVGSLWIDVVAKEAYRCTDATPAAADWIVTTLDAAEVQALINASLLTGSPPYDLGSVSGSLQMHRAQGEVQYASFANDVTIVPPSGGASGKRLILFVDYTELICTLDFSGISMDAAAAALLPITLEAAKAYAIEFAYFGGSWALTDIAGPFPQTIFP